MSTNQQKNNSEEEIDLGSLFVIIGKGFTKFFNFIGSIFKGLFHAFIVVLLFLRNNIVALAIAGIVGGGIGAFLESKSPDLYGSEMLVKPNYKSSKLLYSNINFYNDLMKQKDTVSLEETFGITKEEAGSLKEITVEPIISEYDIVNSYDEFVTEVDTTTIKSYEYEEFKTSFTELDYKIHRIEVLSEKNNVFSKLEKTIILSIENNTYFNRLKTHTYNSINTTDALIKNNISQIDSLQKTIILATIAASEKSTSGTNIDLGSQNSKPKEVELLETNRSLIRDLQDIVEDQSEKNVVLNVVSSFKPIGYKIGGITKNNIFLLGVLSVLLMIFILLLKQLNTYLSNYKK